MRVRFWGTRGSFAMSGREYLRYGGNTSAVEINNSAGNRLLIDLGTGITHFGHELMGAEFGRGEGNLTVLLSHTHLDHIQGLPFFTPIFIKGNTIKILGNEPAGTSLQRVFQDQLNPHYSPLNGLENLAAGVSIEALDIGSSLQIDGFEVSSALVPHGSMESLGFRITADRKTVVFLSDVEYPNEQPTPAALALAKDADLLIHDGMLSDEDYPLRRGWGHSCVSTAVRVAHLANAKRLALFHHSPDSTDDVIDKMVRDAQAGSEVPVFAASERAPIEL